MPQTKPHNKVETEKAIAKYHTAVNKNISEGEVLWNRYNAMLLFNSILITAIGFTYQNNTKLPLVITLYLLIIGLISCYLWFQMTLRGFQWLQYFNDSARELEKEYLDNGCSDINPVLTAKEHGNQIVGWPRVRTASYLIILMIGILYIILVFQILDRRITNQFPSQKNQNRIQYWKPNDWDYSNRKVPDRPNR